MLRLNTPLADLIGIVGKEPRERVVENVAKIQIQFLFKFLRRPDFNTRTTIPIHRKAVGERFGADAIESFEIELFDSFPP